MGIAEKAPPTNEEKKKDERIKNRAEQAKIIEALQKVLEPNEQLLAFTRGRIAGGWRGKLNVGPEAFFAPIVNLGLTERRVILQHIHSKLGTPSELAPHTFPLSQVEEIEFGDVETFSESKACRVVLRLSKDQHFRIRVAGQLNFEGARNLADVFKTISSNLASTQNHSTQFTCPLCQNKLQTVGKFCPYCGGKMELKTEEPQPVDTDSIADAMHPIEADSNSAEPNSHQEVNSSEVETPMHDFSEGTTHAEHEASNAAGDTSFDDGSIEYNDNAPLQNIQLVDFSENTPEPEIQTSEYPVPNNIAHVDFDDTPGEVNEDPPISEFRLYTEAPDGTLSLAEEAGTADAHLPANEVPDITEPAGETNPARSFWHQPEGEF